MCSYLAPELVSKKCERCSSTIWYHDSMEDSVVTFTYPDYSVKHIWLCKICVRVFSEEFLKEGGIKDV